MELRAWQQCQRNPVQCTGTLNLLSPSWDTISALYSQVLKVVSKFPGHRRLVLYFAYKGASVKVDLGDVRAAGVVCILGLGIGLGTLFVYRLYHRYIRPFLDALHWPDPEDSVCSELSFLLDSSDSGVDGAKGNNSDKQLPALLNCVQYGVALGGKGKSANPQTQTVVDSVRLRRTGTRRKPMRKSRTERNARVAARSYLSPVLYDDNFRDSFYSTAESGFETLPECFEEGQDEGEDAYFPREAVSVSSGREKIERYLSSSSANQSNSSPSCNKTVVDVSTLDHEENSEIALTVLRREHVLQTAKSSPARKLGRNSPAGFLTMVKQHSSSPHSVDYDYDPSLDASESIPSFNSSGEECSWEEEGKEECPVPPSQSAMTDIEFRESLMQRVHQWASFAEEYRSRSPTPDRASPVQVPQMRRSRSLDRHLEEPLFISEVMSSSEQAENLTIRNLECLETEFHDIQDEFESITSKLHDLIERGRAEEREEPCRPRPRPSALPRRLCSPSFRRCPGRDRGRSRSPLVCRRRTRWEKMPSSRSESSSSRASSVEFSWDCGEVGGGCETEGGGGGAEGVVDPGGDCPAATSMQGEASCSSQDKVVSDTDSICRVVSVGEAVPIQEYAEREWKGETHKAKTILQGYSTVPDLFHCQRLRQVRGDNYCALRSTLFQVLVGGHQVTRGWPRPLLLIEQFQALCSDQGSGLSQWVFTGRPAWGGEGDQLNKMASCFLTLYVTIEEISVLPSQEERVQRAMAVLNDSQQLDSELMEGMKLMMLFCANDLHRKMREGGDVPTFAHLLFARDTSSDLVNFVKNHLNCVGDSAGIDQVELCLLAHALGVRVRVARLHRHGQEDFDCTFPDEAPDAWPCVCLLAEDDRHYNVPTP